MWEIFYATEHDGDEKIPVMLGRWDWSSAPSQAEVASFRRVGKGEWDVWQTFASLFYKGEKWREHASETRPLQDKATTGQSTTAWCLSINCSPKTFYHTTPHHTTPHHTTPHHARKSSRMSPSIERGITYQFTPWSFASQQVIRVHSTTHSIGGDLLVSQTLFSPLSRFLRSPWQQKVDAREKLSFLPSPPLGLFSRCNRRGIFDTTDRKDEWSLAVTLCVVIRRAVTGLTRGMACRMAGWSPTWQTVTLMAPNWKLTLPKALFIKLFLKN